MILLFCQNMGAQPLGLKWAKQWGDNITPVPLTNRASTVKVAANGDVYVAGVYQGIVDFDPGPATYSFSPNWGFMAYVTRLDSNGNFIWTRQIGEGVNFSDCQALALDSAGNVYLTGNFDYLGNPTYQADFDPGPGTYYFTGNANRHSYLLKLDAAGNFVWANQLLAAGPPSALYAECISRAIELDAAENVYVVGSFKGLVNFNNGVGADTVNSAGYFETAFTAKWNNSGNFAWAKQVGGGGYTANHRAVTLSNNGHVYTTGYCSGGTDVDPGPGVYTIPSSGGALISRLDANGNFVWAKLFDNADGYAIHVDSISNVFTAGIFGPWGDFDTGSGSNMLFSVGGNDMYVSRLDSSGNMIWTGQMGGTTDPTSSPSIPEELPYALMLDRLGEVYLGGYFYSVTPDTDPGPGIYTIVPKGNHDAFVCKLAGSSGNLLWAGQLAGPWYDVIYDLDVDTDRNVYVAGCYGGSCDLDPGINVSIADTNLFRSFVCKLSPCQAAQAPAITSPSMLCSGQGATLTASGTGIINWYNSSGGSILGSGSSYVITGLSAGTHTYYSTASNTCSASFPLTACVLTVVPSQTVSVAVSEITLCAGESTILNAGGASSYTWVNVSNTASTMVTPAANMVYTVYATGATTLCPAEGFVSVIIENCVGIVEPAPLENNIYCYPNPAMDILCIQHSEPIMLHLYDLQGRKWLSTWLQRGQNTINISQLDPGIYLLKVNAQASSFRVVKQ